MASSSETTGLLIVCHGSPLPAANEGFIAMVGRIAARLSMGNVLPAFFALLRPNIQDQVAELASRGVTRIVVMPYFLFQGQHVGVDIPQDPGPMPRMVPPRYLGADADAGERSGRGDGARRAALAIGGRRSGGEREVIARPPRRNACWAKSLLQEAV